MLLIDLPSEKISAYLEKWLQVLSTSIDLNKATATLSDLYQRAGYAAPEVVLVDSPLALLVTCNKLSNAFSQHYSDPNIFERLGTQASNEVAKQMDSLKSLLDEQLKELYINEGSFYFCSDLAFKPHFSEDLLFSNTCEHFEESSTTYANSNSPLKGLLYRAILESGSGVRIRQDSVFVSNNGKLGIRQISNNIHEAAMYDCTADCAANVQQMVNINEAVMYDCAAELGVQFESDLLQRFLNAAVDLGWVILFDEICLVSDRPQVKFDSQGQLHAEGEPAFVFPDGFSRRYFYHGIELPEYMGAVHPRQWKAEWVLQEQNNAELRRILIQEIGYARLSQQLSAEELDSWREYTLLKLPIYDDFATSVQARVPSTNATDAIYLLKMTCPSTNFVYILRIPPSIQRAREAVTWVNWGIEPESFVLET